jgi:hypothetical protein
MNGISPTDYEISSQFAHFFTAAFLVSQFGLLGRWEMIAAASAMLGFAAIKEFGYDLHHENPLIRGSSTLDFFMYAAGVALAVGLWFARG